MKKFWNNIVTVFKNDFLFQSVIFINLGAITGGLFREEYDWVLLATILVFILILLYAGLRKPKNCC